jgi:hypothetical protein
MLLEGRWKPCHDALERVRDPDIVLVMLLVSDGNGHATSV